MHDINLEQHLVLPHEVATANSTCQARVSKRYTSCCRSANWQKSHPRPHELGGRTAGVVIKASLREHDIVLNLRLANSRAVACNDDKLGCNTQGSRFVHGRLRPLRAFEARRNVVWQTATYPLARSTTFEITRPTVSLAVAWQRQRWRREHLWLTAGTSAQSCTPGCTSRTS